MNSRELALAVVRDVFPAIPSGRPRGAHEAFDYRARKSQLDVRDRAFAAELAYGSIKARRFLDWVLAPYVEARSKKLPPTIAEILRLGAYQLRAMHVEPHAAVSESVALAKRYGHRGTAGLVNAVLRRLAEAPARLPQPGDFPCEDEYLATLHSFPTWIVTTIRSVFGAPALEPILGSMNAQAQPAVRVNIVRATVESAIAALEEHGVSVTRSQIVPEILLVGEDTTTGSLDDPEMRWEIQGEIAGVPVDLLDPRPGERILELCSGRGNKTLQIAGRIADRGSVETIELDPKKVGEERRRLERLTVKSVRTTIGDATAADGRPDADAVLLDAPCSGLGILGRQPEARWRKAPDDPPTLASLQSRLLDAAARRIAPAGRLVYSVCTFDPREGRDQIERFLDANPAFARREPSPRYAPWKTDAGDVLVPPLERRDGFFVAILERTSA